MLKYLPPPLLGCLTMSLIAINFVIWLIPLLVLALIKLIFPRPLWDKFFLNLMEYINRIWVCGVRLIIDLTLSVEWEVEGIEYLQPRGSYLLLSNHNNTIDIVALQCNLNTRIPRLRFFVKREILWIPVIGQVLWLFDFLFMKRNSSARLNKRPEEQTGDFETTLNACRKLKRVPFSLISFVEGTRFTKTKQKKQNSPYLNLLKPRFGTAAIVIRELDDVLTSILDVTIAYPANESTNVWDFACGRVPKIVIRVKELPVPSGRFKLWIRKLWEEKDITIESIRSGFASNLTEN